MEHLFRAIETALQEKRKILTQRIAITQSCVNELSESYQEEQAMKRDVENLEREYKEFYQLQINGSENAIKDHRADCTVGYGGCQAH